MRYFKDNWPHLLLTLLATLASTSFALGVSWSVMGSRLSNTERRLDEIDSTHVGETHWQVQQDTASIASLHYDARRTEADVAQINTRLGVIDAKLDAIAETLKRRP